MKYPLVGLSIAFCLGIITAAYIKIPFFAFCLTTFLFLIFSIIFIKQKSKFTIFFLCAIFSLGAALLRNSQILPNCHIAKLIPYKSDVSLIGVVDNDPIYQDKGVSFILKAEKLGLNENVEYLTSEAGTSKIIEMGIMSSPVLVIDDKPVVVGFTPDIEKIKSLIQKAR